MKDIFWNITRSFEFDASCDYSLISGIPTRVMSCIWRLRSRGYFFFFQKQVVSDFEKKYLNVVPGSKEILRQLMMFFLSNDASWKSRWELVLDCHYCLRIGSFCHFGDRLLSAASKVFKSNTPYSKMAANKFSFVCMFISSLSLIFTSKSFCFLHMLTR